MPLELDQIRRRVQARLAEVKRAAVARRDRVAAAERAYEGFLANVAIPTLTAVAQSLSAEGYPCKVSTPGSAVRLVSDRSSRTYIEIRLDATGPMPQVIAEVGRERGHRVLVDDRPVGEGLPIDAITDEHVLAVVVEAIGDLIDR
jgi:hypothetical protein